MDEQSALLIISKILEQAQERKFTKFHLIDNFEEFLWYRDMIPSTKAIIKLLKRTASSVLKDYCKTVITGISDVTQLLAYNQILDASNFYKEDLNIINNMVDEYTRYLCQGNFWYAFLGGDRYDDK